MIEMTMLLQRALLLLSLCFVDEIFCQHGSHTGYSRHRYPNPIKEPLLCGRERVEKSYVCDPDHVLESQKKEAHQLDKLIAQIVNETGCPCSAYSCQQHKEGYKIGIAIIQKMQFDDNNQPRDDEFDDREANRRKVVTNLHQAQLYANDIYKRWMLGRCNEDVIIFYSRSDNAVYTATGEIARNKLTNELVADIARDVRYLGFDRSPFDGLLKMVNDYRLVFLNSYHPRPPHAERSESDFGVSLLYGKASMILPCVIFVLGFFWIN